MPVRCRPVNLSALDESLGRLAEPYVLRLPGLPQAGAEPGLDGRWKASRGIDVRGYAMAVTWGRVRDSEASGGRAGLARTDRYGSFSWTLTLAVLQ
jgi:hypothetical protein